jgi:hypothetical protein
VPEKAHEGRSKELCKGLQAVRRGSESQIEKPAFVSRLFYFGFSVLGYHEQVVPQLVQDDGSHAGALGSVLISLTCISKVRVFPAKG